MKITGEFKFIKRETHECPDDGVHRKGKDGGIKGVHSLVHNDKNLIPKGQDCFYYRVNSEKGIQVYYSFGWFKAHKKKAAIRNFQRLNLFNKLGLSPKPHKVICLELDIKYWQPPKRKHIICHSYGVVVDHVNYPEDIWADYAKGRSYKFPEPHEDPYGNHSPDGYKDFCNKITEQCKKMKIKLDSSLKLGDVIYDVKKGRWFLVDVD